jgi:excisionase family DNA binding protein
VSLTQREERPSPSVRDEILTTEEVCALLKIKKATLYRHTSQGTGPPFCKIGKHIRWKGSEVGGSRCGLRRRCHRSDRKVPLRSVRAQGNQPPTARHPLGGPALDKHMHRYPPGQPALVSGGAVGERGTSGLVRASAGPAPAPSPSSATRECGGRRRARSARPPRPEHSDLDRGQRDHPPAVAAVPPLTSPDPGPRAPAIRRHGDHETRRPT